jgi:hypothetical protein
MIRLSAAVLMCALASHAFSADEPTPAMAGPAVTEGQMLVGSDGTRIGRVIHVGSDGSPQVMFNGRLVTIPVASLSTVNDRLTTSLTKDQLVRR